MADLERALAFYRGLGLESKGVVGTEWADEKTGANGAIAMFKFEGGLLLNLYPRADLAKDAAIPVGPPQSGEFSLAQLVRSREEVDELLKNAAAAGATVTPVVGVLFVPGGYCILGPLALIALIECGSGVRGFGR